nr:acyltransferase family protein [uncultured Pseudodesulfovibrio sp.]
MRYRPEIDGLRAVAVLGVFLFHLGLGPFSGGWLGVDIFFVISGYLISSLLFRELAETGTVSLSGFYLRRVRRIGPALLVCLIGSFPLALVVAKTYIFSQYCQSLLAALFSVSNIFFWQHAGYFELDAQLSPLLHTWTLGVEEQFYFIIPILFVLLGKLAPRRKPLFFGGLFALMVGSFLACRYGRDFLSTPFRFYMLPTRGWELLVGIFTALILHVRPNLRRRTILTEILSMAGLAFVVFCFIYYSGGSHFTEKALFVTLGTALFIGTVTESSICGRVLGAKPVRFIGKISYSLYLWHWPLIFLWNLAALRYGFSNGILPSIAILLVATLIATLSWKFVETPFRRKGSWSSCLKPLVPLALVVCVLAWVGFTRLGGGQTVYALNEDGAAHFSSYEDIEQGHYYPVGPQGQTPQFILIGDSHAKAFSPAVIALADEYGIAGVTGMKDGTGPLPNIRRLNRLTSPPFAARWQEHILRGDIKNVLMVAKWDRYYHPESWKYLGSYPQWNPDTAMRELRDTVQAILDAGCEVWILDEVPNFSKDPIVMTRIHDNKPWQEPLEADGKIHFARKALTDIHSPHLHILDPYPVLAPEGRVTAVRDGRFLYKDTTHLTSDGALLLKPVLRPMFDAMRAEDRQ